jgi:hypothetical protein
MVRALVMGWLGDVEWLTLLSLLSIAWGLL